MTYHMTYDIQVGAYKVQTLVSATVRHSVESLADTAEIVLPGTLINAAIEVESKIHVGDPVTIRLGYSETSLNDVQLEFEGYLKAIRTDTADIILECEDPLWLFRQTMMPDKEQPSTSLKGLLQMVTSQVQKDQGTYYKVDCDFDYSYEKFVFNHASAYDVLRKIQEETSADIYMQDGTLYLHPAYSKTSDTVMFDFAVNICGSDIKYVREADKNIRVKVECTLPDGKKKHAEYGNGQTEIKRTVPGGSTSTTATLKQLAKNEYNVLCYDGYEGSITGWLIPYCKPTDLVSLHDGAYEYKDGTYYVLATETTFSNAGGRRKITLGRRMS